MSSDPAKTTPPVAASESADDNERRFRALTENSSDLVVVTDASGRFAYVGPSVERILGFRPEALIGLDGLAPIHRDDAGRVREVYGRLAGEPGARATVVYRVRHRDGSWRWLESVAANLLDDPAVAGIIVNSRDITTRQEAVAAYRAVVDHSLQGLMILQDLRIVFANPAMAAITARSTEALRALTAEQVGEMVHPDDRALVRERVLRRLAGEPPGAHVDHRFVRPDGSVRWVEAHASLIEYRGRPAIQVAYLDVSERKAAQESARRQQEQLAHVLRRRTMGEMAAIFAHEVNQPLTAMANYAKGCAHRLRAGSITPEQMLGALDEIAAQAVRAGEIVRRLRSFVGRGEPQREPARLDALVQAVLPFIEPEARDRRVRLSASLPTDLPAVAVDVVQIEQVVFNLLRNGLEAIGAQPDGGAQLAVTARRSGDAVEIAVCDSGVGVAAERLGEIFEPFVSSKPGGLGMGLTICRSIVEAHGGTVRAAANPEGGMTFTVSLPLTPTTA